MLNWLAVWSVPVFAASFVMCIAGIWLAAWLIIRLPEDHFVRLRRRPENRHPALHAAWVVIRNVVGGALVVAGIAMIILPGQGVLSILLGLSLMDFPGKHQLVVWLSRRTVRRTLNWIRGKANRPPLQFPNESGWRG